MEKDEKPSLSQESVQSVQCGGEGSHDPSSRTQGQWRGAGNESETEKDAETETPAESEVETDGKRDRRC